MPLRGSAAEDMREIDSDTEPPRLNGGGGPTGENRRDGSPRFPYPATCLMRAIISSTAFSTVHFSLTTRFIAFAQTFSLFRIVNL